jgi:hypothetical protein
MATTTPRLTRLTDSTAGRAARYGLGAAALTLLAIGLPAALIDNPVFARQLPARPLDYLVLGLTVLLAGAIGATYAWPVACPTQERKLFGGGLLAFLAVGCPTCNKLAVLLLGASGAIALFEPVQPLLAVAGLALLAAGLWLRLRAIAAARA